MEYFCLYLCPPLKKQILLNPMSEKKHEEGVDIQQTLSKAEHYLNENKKSLSIIVGAIFVIVLGYLGYKQFWVKPQEESASKAIFYAQQYFKADSLDLAMNGQGKMLGFKQIIDQYGSSSSANLAHYYLGMCYLKKGQYKEAIESLKSYDAEDDLSGAMALGGIGDANLELGNKDEALSYYKKAAGYDDNKFTSPYFMKKTAFVYEQMGDYKTAAETYQKIQNDYPDSNEGREAPKYIARAEAMIKE